MLLHDANFWLSPEHPSLPTRAIYRPEEVTVYNTNEAKPGRKLVLVENPNEDRPRRKLVLNKETLRALTATEPRVNAPEPDIGVTVDTCQQSCARCD